MASPNTKRDEKLSSNDLYSTPEQALNAIQPYLIKDILNVSMKKEDNNSLPLVTILEPCAGIGDISNWLIDLSTQLVENVIIMVDDNELYDHGYDTTYNCDFLYDENEIPADFDIMVVNPPYNKAADFILKGFEYAPVQWHFLRLTFLEGQERFRKLFNLGKLSDVYIFTYRVSCPKGVHREPTATSVPYAWFRFDKNYYGEPKLHWLTK